ncbi:MAG: preprotein translocase subunit SecG [Planctomycetota bacterium]|nr:preprotein translocase subunit SecG [Planctomycetota bacterium]
MTFTLLASLTGVFLGWLMGFLSLFLILLILVQRGKGGGLAGALGGPGGESAFGSKGADTFTTITIFVALFWGFTCAFTMYVLGTSSTQITETNLQATPGEMEAGTGMEITPGSGDEAGSEAAMESLGSESDIGGETIPSAEVTPAAETPAAETPAAEIPAAETPAAETEVTPQEGESSGDLGDASTSEDGPAETESTEAAPAEAESVEAETSDP